MINKLRQFASWSTMSNRAGQLRFLLEIISAGAGIMYTMETNAQKASEFVFLIAMGIMIFWTLLIIIISGQYGPNVLTSNPNSGILFDRSTRLENVSLRRKTLGHIFTGFLDNQTQNRDILLKNVGKQIGIEFVQDYQQHVRLGSHGTGNIDKILLLREICEYDSSSGMGKFSIVHVKDWGEYSFEVEIKNAFTSIDTSKDKDVFLEGYIEGIWSAMYPGKNFIASIDKTGSSEVLRILVKE